MTGTDLIDHVSWRTGYTKKDVKLILDTSHDIIVEKIIQQGVPKIEIRGFGTFKSKILPRGRIVRNPKTGERKPSGLSIKLIFKPGQRGQRYEK